MDAELVKQIGKVLSLAFLTLLVWVGANHPNYEIPTAAWFVFGAIAGVDVHDQIKKILNREEKK